MGWEKGNPMVSNDSPQVGGHVRGGNLDIITGVLLKKSPNSRKGMIPHYLNGYKRDTSKGEPLMTSPQSAKPTIDSIFWKCLMAPIEDLDKCTECRAEYRTTLKTTTPLKSLGEMSKALRLRSNNDPLAKGMWSVVTHINQILHNVVEN